MIQKEELEMMKEMNTLLKMKENNMGRNVNEIFETIHIQTPWSDLSSRNSE